MNVVTGMHRSGTSFLAQVLDQLGADFGDPQNLFRADKWNQNGYFEHVGVVDTNNRMILGPRAKMEYWLDENERFSSRLKNALLSRKWKYFLFPALKKIHARAGDYATDLRAVHDQYQGKFVKDPRFCLTLSPWRDRGPLEGLVFSYRHPSLVAGSLARREKLPRGFGYRYWLYHVQNFFRQLQPGDRLLLVDFDAFFSDLTRDAEYEKIARWLTGTGLEAGQLESLKAILDLDLRTQNQIDETGNARALDVYQSLRHLDRTFGGAVQVAADDADIRAIAAP